MNQLVDEVLQEAGFFLWRVDDLWRFVAGRCENYPDGVVSKGPLNNVFLRPFIVRHTETTI